MNMMHMNKKRLLRKKLSGQKTYVKKLSFFGLRLIYRL